MSTKKKLALICGGSIVVLLLLSITLLPWVVRSQAVKAIREATGRTAHIERISFNPFTLTLTVDKFGLDGLQADPFVAINRLRLSLASVSIFKRALIVDEITVDSPAISFARLAPNSYSFNDIIERQKKQPKKESSGEFRYSLNNIRITNGSIDFDDRAVEGGRKHSLKKLELGIPFISNIPHLAETKTEPKLSALVNGSPFNFDGTLKPFSRSRETSLQIDLKDLDLPGYAAYSPVKLPVELVSGAMTINSRVSYLVSADKKPELTISGLLQLDRIEVNQRDAKALLKLPSLKVNATALEIFSKRFDFDSIILEGVQIFAERDKKGVLSYTRLLPPPSPSKAAPAPEKSAGDGTAKTATITAKSLQIKEAALHFSDALPPGGFKTTLSEIDLQVSDFSTTSGTSARYDFSMLMDNQATLNAEGTFSPAPLAATSSLELSDLSLQKGWPYLAQFLTAPVKGNLDAELDLSYSGDKGLEVKNGSVTLKGISTSYGSKEGFDLALLELKGAGFSQKEQRATAADLRLSKGSITLSKESDGSLSLLSLLKSSQKTASAVPAKTAAPPKTAKAAKPFSWSLKRFQLDRFNASFTDKSRSESPKFTLSGTQLTLDDINGPRLTPIRLKLSSTFNGQAPLKASGILTPLPFRYQGGISLAKFQIRDFEDYFPESLNVFVVDGSVDSSLKVDIALKEGKPAGSFQGSCGVRSFHSIDALNEEDLLKWESLQFDEIRGNLEPFSLAIREVALNGVYSRIVVRQDGTLNLQNLVDKPAAEKQAPQAGGTPQAATQKPPTDVKPIASAAPATAPAAVPPAASPAKKAITIGAVTVQEGTISFTDRHLPQTFSSTFYNLGGRVSGLSSEETKLADVDLRGNLENHSPLQITGRINPLREDLFIDLKLSFKDIDLSPVTPYSGTYLGYTVEKGKLFLDLKYLIDKKQLSSENNVFIDQFTFGKKVESEKATSLPVRLAVALLKDRKGEIHLDLPVSGRTDYPQFSIWGVVWQVVKNLITKAVTSPFALLSSMMGGGQDFSSIPFDPGTSRLTPAEEQKLTALAKALADRPGIKVEIKGYVEREKDAEGYRREQLNHKMRSEKFLLLAKGRQVKTGENADSLQILPEESSRLLKAVYKKEKFPKPRNAIGLVKDLPDDEMRKLIITNTIVGETELQGLARERATTVMDYLVKKGGLPAERLFQKNDDIHKAPEKEGAARSRVEFNAIAQ